MCLVFNDISYFQFFVKMHKLSSDTIGQARVHPSLLSQERESGGKRAYHGKTRNNTIQLVLQQCCGTSCTFLLPVLPYLKAERFQSIH